MPTRQAQRAAAIPYTPQALLPKMYSDPFSGQTHFVRLSYRVDHHFIGVYSHPNVRSHRIQHPKAKAGVA